MRILFITAHYYLPQMRGGLQSSTDALCRCLLRRGHRVAVLAGFMPGGRFAFKCRIKMKINQKVFHCKVARETGLPYPVWYAWLPWDAVTQVARRQKSELIVVLQHQSVRMAMAARKTGLPFLMSLADVEFHQHGGAFEELGDVPCVANSHFTAERYRRAYGVNPKVIYPLVLSERYKVANRKETVTFINPHPQKGLRIAIEIARQCPEIPFAFVEAWPLSSEERFELTQNLASLSNVILCPPQSDMRRIYARSGILLAPSIWEEAFGRVAAEAQINGIPVIGSTRGGLPEAIGSGGVLLDPDQPVDDWVAAVRKLWEDKDYYSELSTAARCHAQRRELSFPHQIEAWEAILSDTFHAYSNSPARKFAALENRAEASVDAVL